MSHGLIQVGTGGRGESWCQSLLQPEIEAGRIEPVAAVDVDPDALENAQTHLGLSPERCYTEMEPAFANHDADFCTVVVPPEFHEDVVDVALDHGMDILSEKPIADTLAASVRIVEKVREAGVKMGVTMNHRFFRGKRTLHRELRSGDHGPLNYVTCQFTRDQRGETGTYRLEIDQPLVIDASIHHLDFLRGFAGSDPETVYAHTWNRPWDNHEGDTNALVLIEFQNGVHVAYEGAKTNAVGLHPWGNEYVRAECRDATLLMDDGTDIHPDDGLECLAHDPDTLHDGAWTGKTRGDGEVIPYLEGDTWGAELLIERFVDWLEGGEPMETNVEANLPSMALVQAVIESSERGEAVHVPTLLEETREQVSSDTPG